MFLKSVLIFFTCCHICVKPKGSCQNPQLKPLIIHHLSIFITTTTIIVNNIIITNKCAISLLASLFIYLAWSMAMKGGILVESANPCAGYCIALWGIEGYLDVLWCIERYLDVLWCIERYCVCQICHHPHNSIPTFLFTNSILCPSSHLHPHLPCSVTSVTSP